MAKSTSVTYSYAQGKRAVVAALRCKRSILLEGPPGVGKTSMVREACAEVKLPCRILIGSNMDAVDVAGLPYRDLASGKVLRELFPEIAACVEAPGALFLDEFTTVPASVEAPLMRLLLERNAGGTKLHADSPVVAACNPPEQAPNAREIASTTGNRLSRIQFCPTVGEVTEWFAAQQGDEHTEHRDFGATLQASPDLITFTPPAASIDAGEPWGSPRGWEIGLDLFASAGADEADDVAYGLLAGAVGEASATAYLSIRKLRKYLPTVDAIAKDPSGCTVPGPEHADRQVAALGVLSRVAERDLSAAWVYAERLIPEIGAAASRVLMTRAATGASKHAQAGRAAQVRILARVKKAIG